MINFEEIVEKAKITLIKDGYHSYIILAIDDTGDLFPIQAYFGDEEEKFAFIQKMRLFMKENNIIKYFSINEMWGRFIKEEDAEYVKNNIDTERPTAYPESMRSEGLIVQEQNIDGSGNVYIGEFKREDEKIVFTKEIRENNLSTFRGAMINFFV